MGNGRRRGTGLIVAVIGLLLTIGCQRAKTGLTQGHVSTIDEQLQQLGISPATLDYVLLSHLDCDHANGLRAVKDAKACSGFRSCWQRLRQDA